MTDIGMTASVRHTSLNVHGQAVGTPLLTSTVRCTVPDVYTGTVHAGQCTPAMYIPGHVQYPAMYSTRSSYYSDLVLVLLGPSPSPSPSTESRPDLVLSLDLT